MQPQMQLTPLRLVMQFAHSLQQCLFPMEAELGPLTPQLRLLAGVMAMAPLERFLGARRALTGRPARDRAALATAFIAKAIFNLSTTRELIDRLRHEENLRRLCGWDRVRAIPHESKFSRAFAEFAGGELAQHLHAAVIEATQKDRLIGHIARDSTAIPVRERYPETAQQAKEKEKKKKKGKAKRPKGKSPRAKARERGTRIERQRKQSVKEMLRELPRQCDSGTKKNSKGHEQHWRGYKLHLDVGDGQIPVTALLTSASVHDSQVAIPLMTITTQRTTHFYEVMDSAYDAGPILEHSRQLNHVPIVQPHPRRGTKKPSQLPKVFPVKLPPQLCPAKQERFKERTMVERVNARLKDEFGARHIRVRGAAKVMAHLMFGVLALTVDQWLRLAPPG